MATAEQELNFAITRAITRAMARAMTRRDCADAVQTTLRLRRAAIASRTLARVGPLP